MPYQPTGLGSQVYHRGRPMQAVGKRALRYASQQLTMAPQTMFPHPHLPGETPRYWNVKLRSEALPHALAALAADHKTSISAPLISSFAAIMAVRASLPLALIYLGSNNRFLKDWKEFSGPLFQETLATVPMNYQTYHDLMAAVGALSLRAYKHARSDPILLAERIYDLDISRGVSSTGSPGLRQ
jgi:hypothetical protein